VTKPKSPRGVRLAPSRPGRLRPACPFPTDAIYNGTSNPNFAESGHCGGDVPTKDNVCSSNRCDAAQIRAPHD